MLGLDAIFTGDYLEFLLRIDLEDGCVVAEMIRIGRTQHFIIAVVTKTRNCVIKVTEQCARVLHSLD